MVPTKPPHCVLYVTFTRTRGAVTPRAAQGSMEIRRNNSRSRNISTSSALQQWFYVEPLSMLISTTDKTICILWAQRKGGRGLSQHQSISYGLMIITAKAQNHSSRSRRELSLHYPEEAGAGKASCLGFASSMWLLSTCSCWKILTSTGKQSRLNEYYQADFLNSLLPK